ncbi:MAG: pentapeptide repeat-containing protein [Anaerolineae bacterium]|nr:pentapeptide repeat-containing protein [Anaerolineae bacterium]
MARGTDSGQSSWLSRKLQRDGDLDQSREAALQTYFRQLAQLLPGEQKHFPVSETEGGAQTRARAIAMFRNERDTSPDSGEAPEGQEDPAGPDPAARAAAQTQTLSVLRELDGERKGRLLGFLHGSGLVGKEAVIILYGADLSDTVLHKGDLWGINLSGANLRRADFWETKLPSAILQAADLREANLSNTDLWASNLDQADLTRARATSANLSGASLSKAYLCEACLSEADFSGAKMTEANLALADLTGAGMSKADLHAAILWGSKLVGTDLSEADLSGADLVAADLSRANLARANLRWARVSPEQMHQAGSLAGATMPDGSRHS